MSPITQIVLTPHTSLVSALPTDTPPALFALSKSRKSSVGVLNYSISRDSLESNERGTLEDRENISMCYLNIAILPGRFRYQQ
jgi:hypothetical protein